MFPLAHMGIGSKFAAPFSSGLPRKWLLWGTLLPDLIDKPLYYGLSWSTGLKGAELGQKYFMISGTRTFGHSAIFLVALALMAFFTEAKWLAALSLGVATHIALDHIATHISHGSSPAELQGLLWPFLGLHFPVIPFRDLHEHLLSWRDPLLIDAEAAGAALLAWDFWKNRHQSEILAFIREKRRIRKIWRFGKKKKSPVRQGF